MRSHLSSVNYNGRHVHGPSFGSSQVDGLDALEMDSERFDKLTSYYGRIVGPGPIEDPAKQSKEEKAVGLVPTLNLENLK